MSNDLSKHLWNDSPLNAGYSDPSLYNSHILEQYKLYVEMADRISSRRDTANAFFLTLNGLVLGAGATIVEKSLRFQNKWLLFFPYLVIVLQIYFWWRLIASFKQLNGAKFQIVGELETRLPASPYRKAEWHYLLKEGKDYKAYWPLTHLESKIPWIFFGGYTVALIVLLMSS